MLTALAHTPPNHPVDPAPITLPSLPSPRSSPQCAQLSLTSPGSLINTTAYAIASDYAMSFVNATGYDPNPAVLPIPGISCNMFGPCAYSGVFPNA